MKIMKCVGSDVGLVRVAWTCSYWFPFPKRSRFLSVSSCKFPNKPVSYMGKWMIRMNWFGDGDYVFLSLSWSWELGRTAEARRFARLLEERDGLWKIGTVRIIWSLRKLSKYVGGRYSPWITLCDLKTRPYSLRVNLRLRTGKYKHWMPSDISNIPISGITLHGISGDTLLIPLYCFSYHRAKNERIRNGYQTRSKKTSHKNSTSGSDAASIVRWT